MKCPYTLQDCSKINTLFMSKELKCSDCEFYNKGVIPTGATPNLQWLIDKFKLLFKIK